MSTQIKACNVKKNLSAPDSIAANNKLACYGHFNSDHKATKPLKKCSKYIFHRGKFMINSSIKEENKLGDLKIH